MKKLIIIIPILILLLTGCRYQETKTGTIKCSLNSNDVVNGYSLESSYIINYTDNYVDKVNTKEVITSDSEDILEYFEQTLNNTYSATNEAYGGYTFNITNENGKLISNVTIDYSKMDINKFVNDQPILKKYIENNKMLVEGIKAIYTATGATCE